MQAWAWVEWKEGNLDVARELFQRAIAIDPRSMDAVRSFQVFLLHFASSAFCFTGRRGREDEIYVLLT